MNECLPPDRAHPTMVPGPDDAGQKCVADLFRAAIALEKRVGAIYGQLAGRFAHHPEIHDFWKGMQADEIDHAEALGKIRASRTPEDLNGPVATKVWQGAVELERLLSGDRVGSVKTLDDAYLLAHEIEFSEVNAIFKFLASGAVPMEARSAFVIAQISQHQEKITSFNRSFGDRVWRGRISAIR